MSVAVPLLTLQAFMKWGQPTFQRLFSNIKTVTNSVCLTCPVYCSSDLRWALERSGQAISTPISYTDNYFLKSRGYVT